MADEIITPDPLAFDPTAPVIASAPLSIGGQQQASAVRVTSVLTDGTSYTPDETLPGGYFIVGGKSVNSEGYPINEKGQRLNEISGRLMTPEEIFFVSSGR